MADEPSPVVRPLPGADPAAELKAKRKEMRIAELVDLYEKEGCYIQRGKRQGEAMKPLTKQYTLARLRHHVVRSEEHTSELQSLMRISYAVFCLKKKNKSTNNQPTQKVKHKHTHNKTQSQVQ